MNILIPGFAIASFGFFADLALKATVLLLLAGFFVIILRRHSAASRHAVCVLTAGTLLLLPVLVSVSPDWRMAVLPSEAPAATRTATDSMTGRTESATPSAAPPAATTEWVERTPVTPSADPVSQAAPKPLLTAADSNAGPLPIAAHETATSSAPLDWRSGVVVFWLGGTFLLLTTVLGAHLRVACLVRRARRLPNGHSLVEGLADSARMLGVKRTIVLRLTARNSIPFTCGLRRPTIVLPETAENWSEERVQAVLLHELAHVKRRDCLTQFLAQTCVALYWFHPLAWLLSRRMRIEREKACDDLVLNAGIRPAQYGETLLSVASNRETRTGAPCAALAMAKKSSLEGRLLAIMDTQQNRNALSRAALAAGLVACATVAMTIASVRLTADEQAPINEDTPVIETALEEPAVLSFSGRLEIRHETHGNLLHEFPIREISTLSGQSNGYSFSAPWATISTRIEGALVDSSINIAGNVSVRQRGGFETADRRTEFVRLETPFEGTLHPSDEDQTIDLGKDVDGRVALLILTPTVLEKEKRVEWLINRIAWYVNSMHRRIPDDVRIPESTLLHAEVLHLAAEQFTSPVRTQRLVDYLSQLIEFIEAGETDNAARVLQDIDRTGAAIREDFDAWNATVRVSRSAETDPAPSLPPTPDDPFAPPSESAQQSRGLFGPPDDPFAAPSEAARQSRSLFGPPDDPFAPPSASAQQSRGFFGPPVDPFARQPEEKQSLRVTLLGEVNRPGVYELDPGSTIIHALGHAGGWTGTARLNQVQIHRGRDRLLMDVGAMLFGDGDVMNIEDGDVIILRERIF